jgi:hypothetical protein
MVFSKILQAAALFGTTTLASYLPCGLPHPLNYNIRTQILEGIEPDLPLYDQDSIASGVSTAFGNTNGPIPWPRDKKNLITIPYCYAREYDKTNVRTILEPAISSWEKALGGKASKDAGHGIVFKEVKDDDGKSIYCKKSGADCIVRWD